MTPDLFTGFPLRRARVHEVFGPSAMGFAAMAAGLSAGSSEGCLLWIREAWQADHLQPPGLAAFLDPAALLMARTRDQTDSLAVAEEALRDGTVPFVVIELTRPLNLREGRRLQLAAKAGGTTGLCIIPEGMGSNAAETRWHATPVFDPAHEDSTLMRWQITKNKSGTLGVWDVRWIAETRRLHVVSPPLVRAGAADLPG
ncbi:MAG: ImuA family protein [Paracoccus sp. (in: a-proteobacteria)]